MKPFSFQVEDIDRLVEQTNVLLSWEMGLGKTYGGIQLDLARRDQTALPFGRTLIVCPMSVFSVWEDHYAEHAPHLKVVTIDPRGAKKRRDSWGDFKTYGNVFICHWDVLRLMPELRTEFAWLHIIADEAHRAKNRKAQQTQALKKIKAQYKSALTGTPITNLPHDLWSILNWLHPQEFRSYWKFYNRYVEYEELPPAGYHKITGPKNEKELQQRMAPFYAFRSKEKELPNLPPMLPTMRIKVTLSPKEQRAYNEMKKDMIAWVGEHEDQPVVAPVAISRFMRLQQFSVSYATWEDGRVKMTEPSSKLDALRDLIEDNPEEQFVIFTNYKDVIGLVQNRLDRMGVTHVTITGDTPKQDRARCVREFQERRARCFLGTIGAAGEGITLHSASAAVFLDRSWSPAKNRQAEDRLHRIGQKRPVQIVDIIARDTVEIGKDAALVKKWDWIKRTLGQ